MKHLLFTYFLKQDTIGVDDERGLTNESLQIVGKRIDEALVAYLLFKTKQDVALPLPFNDNQQSRPYSTYHTPFPCIHFQTILTILLPPDDSPTHS